MYKTIAEVKIANKNKGYFFFSPDTMRFFNSEIESEIIKGKYFITSERMKLSMPKLYTIREAKENGSIDTVGNFQQYTIKMNALLFIKNYL